MGKKDKDTASSERKSLKKVVKSKVSNLKADANLEKAVKNVQKIFEKRAIEDKAKKDAEKHKAQTNTKHNRFKQNSFTNKGLVYLGHIPHGFYEEQMKDYFQQFGNVTRIRVARSKRTGKSRGYGYVEFLNADVAKIAAETMHNYLMYGRLLKATYIPPERQHQGFFWKKNWSEEEYPKLKERQEMIRCKNAVQSTEDYKRFVQKSCGKLSNLQKKLEAKGISMKFQPADMP